MKKKTAVVVGAGLGGMSAAIRLTADGYDVKVIEKNSNLGGKLNKREGKGFTFDTGPSILTMPWVLEQLFESVHRRLDDYITVERVEPQWRTFFEDGTSIDVTSDLPNMLEEMAKVTDRPNRKLTDFLSYSQDMYELCMKSFYKYSISDLKDLKSHHKFSELLQMDPMNTVAKSTRKFFDNKYLEQLFNYFVMYVGSNPYATPAILNQLVYVQLGLGIYYVKGGLYNIAEAMGRLMEELRVDVQFNSPVRQLVVENERVIGVETEDGTVHEADVVVSNLEAIPAYRKLAPQTAKVKKETKSLEKKFDPTVSGLVLLLGTNRKFNNLKHHNFFFSEDPELEFKQIYEQGKPADDPTIYIGISARSDESQAPAGKDNLFVLTHVPPLENKKRKPVDWDAYRETVLDKLERMGMEGVRDSIEFEYRFTPEDLERLYGPNGGSIYGIAADRKSNGGFKIPSKSQVFEGLYFVGGSTHPGGGVPMVTLSGQLTADLIKENETEAVHQK
ncbi:phytoene desaturase family protein [Halobacillus sp. ACCC02827]|nr:MULTISPECIES: phytoene desaturase family protein [unclassified Halobacillus]ELK46671.1 phytoene desaturase [Halobacillus sp. BAB-2008]QHT45317.1 phytoene desaturase [Bacillus sp. SB49]WJE16101.1 phytoene desaturase family protein [Halobacillus sp. ACCC02827]